MEVLKRFYVVTQSGGVHEVVFSPRKKITSIKKVFTLDPKNSRVGNGYQLFPEGHFVAITKNQGLVKYQPDNGKRIRFFEDTWEGHFTHTSDIIDLFFKKNDAVKYCKDKYKIYTAHHYESLKTEETILVMKAIGKEHPVFNIQEDLFPKENDIPF